MSDIENDSESLNTEQTKRNQFSQSESPVNKSTLATTTTTTTLLAPLSVYTNGKPRRATLPWIHTRPPEHVRQTWNGRAEHAAKRRPTSLVADVAYWFLEF